MPRWRLTGGDRPPRLFPRRGQLFATHVGVRTDVIAQAYAELVGRGDWDADTSALFRLKRTHA